MNWGCSGHWNIKQLRKKLSALAWLCFLPALSWSQWAYQPNPMSPILSTGEWKKSPEFLGADTSVQKFHSPKKATIMAIVLPGSGQIYNQKYWKVPLVYAGLGGSIWAINHFRSEMRLLNDSISGIFQGGKTPSAQLIADRDQQRSRRDIAILCLAGVYIFQVVDATVDAHFFKFNLNENLGLRLSPSPTRTLALQYRF